MKKTGFTLVEMLIVVVIIGILSAALLPRLTGYMARTRDLKRQADLRNIAVAIEMYGINHGEFPFYQGGYVKGCDLSFNFFRSANNLKQPLEDYISSIPTDPKKTTQIDICRKNHRGECLNSLGKGSYLYTIQREKMDAFPLGQGKNIALIAAKVETADYANFVLVDREGTEQTGKRRIGEGWNFGIGNCATFGMYPGRIGEKFNLCSSVKKGQKSERIQQEDGSFKCTYTTEDQLYYIVKID